MLRVDSRCLAAANPAFSVKARWFVVACALLAMLGSPAAAPARHRAAGDGTLVVQKGSAPTGVPVVTLVIKGTVVGRLSSGSPDLLDTVVIDNCLGAVSSTRMPREARSCRQRR
jgi:hypothetical protein